jgi:hypothetical protein
VGFHITARSRACDNPADRICESTAKSPFPCCILGYPNRANGVISTSGTAKRSGAFCRFGVALWFYWVGDFAPDAVSVAKEWDGGGSDRHHHRDSTSAFDLVFPLVASRGFRVQETFLVTRLRARRRSGRGQRDSRYSRFASSSCGAVVPDECLWRIAEFYLWCATHGDAGIAPRALGGLVSGGQPRRRGYWRRSGYLAGRPCVVASCRDGHRRCIGTTGASGPFYRRKRPYSPGSRPAVRRTRSRSGRSFSCAPNMAGFDLLPLASREFRHRQPDLWSRPGLPCLGQRSAVGNRYRGRVAFGTWLLRWRDCRRPDESDVCICSSGGLLRCVWRVPGIRSGHPLHVCRGLFGLLNRVGVHLGCVHRVGARCRGKTQTCRSQCVRHCQCSGQRSPHLHDVAGWRGL